MERIQDKVKQFTNDRPILTKHDTPETVSRLLVGEVNEFLESVENGDKWIDKALELADIGFYVLVLANYFDVDIQKAIEAKLAINELRFPSHLFQEGDFGEIYQARKVWLGERQSIEFLPE